MYIGEWGRALASGNKLKSNTGSNMAKGTKKNPIIAHVQTEQRLNEIASLCDERGWKFIIGLEPDKPEDISDIERLLNPPAPRIVYNVGRNESYPCGSGKKYKKCCGK